MHAGLAWRSSGSPHRMHCRAAQVAALAKRALNVPHGQSALLWEARTGAVRCGAPSVASSCAQRRGARCLPLPVPREPVPRCALLWATLSSPLVPFPCSLLQRDSWLCMYARMMPTTGLLLERLYTCTVVKMRGRRRERERESMLAATSRSLRVGGWGADTGPLGARALRLWSRACGAWAVLAPAPDP
jgi:hypothetical protein